MAHYANLIFLLFLLQQLLKCTEKALNECGKTPTLLALGRAVLSYVVFDRKLSVCRWHGYSSLYNLLKTGKPLVTDITYK